MVSWLLALLVGNSGFLTIFVAPLVLGVLILWLCKRYNFSLIPDDLKGSPRLDFKLPKLSREKADRMYKWSVEDDSDYSDSDYSE